MKDVTHVIDTMKTVILFREMYDLCMSRVSEKNISACISCPYSENGVCNKTSTVDVLNNAANVFQEFLEEQ